MIFSSSISRYIDMFLRNRRVCVSFGSFHIRSDEQCVNCLHVLLITALHGGVSLSPAIPPAIQRRQIMFEYGREDENIYSQCSAGIWRFRYTAITRPSRMANTNGNVHSVHDNTLPSDLPAWAYDLHPDDDEFRAGYPFSDVPELEPTGELNTV